MTTTPLYEITSHIAGKNAKVRVFPDRVEWERSKSLSGGKMTAAVLTVGMSAAATGGVTSRKGAGTEVIPMRSISSVTTQRDSILNEIVSVITAGNTIDMRCSKSEAEQLKSLIMQGINGSLHEPAVAAPAASATPPPPPPQPKSDLPPADWYSDPKGESRLRYWDGARWTDHVHG